MRGRGARWLSLLPLLLAPALGACGDDVPSFVARPDGVGGSGYAGGDDANSPWARDTARPPDLPGADAAGDEEARGDAGPPDTGSPDTGSPDAGSYNCPEIPTAYVMEAVDPYTGVLGDASSLLAAAGFDVRPLPLDRDPQQLRGLIYFGSFVSETQAYRDYILANVTNLEAFVARANVLLQMTQADQTELRPPFLPGSQTARRTDLDVGALVALDVSHPLLEGVPLDTSGNLLWHSSRVGWETFGAQIGFGVLLAVDRNATSPALLEGPSGEGRFVLTAMALDKPEGAGPDRDRFNQAFFRNLYRYARDVCRRQARAVNVTPSPGSPVFGNGAFTLAVLPDTQYYSQDYPGFYLAQVAWIVANVERLRIPYVFHLGDIVNGNTPLEWQRAAEAMNLLDGVVPYTLVPGNHDLGPSGSAVTRDTLLNEYFSFEKTAAWPTFGGAYETGKLENTYHLFSAGGRDYIVLALEWGPRDQVIAWANDVMTQHPHRYGILTTHAYLNNDNRRYDITVTDPAHPQTYDPHMYATPGGVNDGEELWQKLVRKHPFVMTLNGHVLGSGTGYLVSVTDTNTTCHQMLSNYQMRDQGGEGYMRLLEFEEGGHTIKVYSYSPLFDSFLVTPDQNFTITLDLPPGAGP